jgi:hypothetical protein
VDAGTRRRTLPLTSTALSIIVALLTGCGVFQTAVEGRPAAEGSSADSTATLPPLGMVHTEEPDGRAVYDVAEGLKVENWGYRSYKFTDAGTYEASWGVVISNTRSGNWIPLGARFEITFFDATGVEVGKDDYPSLGLMPPGAAAAASGQADGLTGPPARVRIHVSDVDWSEEGDAATLKDAVKIDVAKDARFIITDAIVTTKADVTNVTAKPIRVNLQVLYLDSRNGIVAGAVDSIKEISPGQTTTTEVVGSGTKATLEQFEHILIYAQTWPDRMARDSF